MKKAKVLSVLFLLLIALPVYAGDVHTYADDVNLDLLKAAKDGDKFLVKILLAKGAKVNSKDGEGRTALMLAAGNNYQEIIKVLLDSNADINVKDKNDKTALMMVKEKGFTKIVELIEQHNANMPPPKHPEK